MYKSLLALAATCMTCVTAAVISERATNTNPNLPITYCTASAGWVNSWGGQQANYDNGAQPWCDSRFPSSNLIKTINAYAGANGAWTIITLEIIFNDGTTIVRGDPGGVSSGAGKTTITFGPGEMINSAWIADNGQKDQTKNRLGAIHFETSLGQSITLGPSKSNTVTQVNVGSGLMVGMAGTEGGEIGRATLLFLPGKISSISTGPPQWIPGFDPTQEKPSTGSPILYTTHYWNGLTTNGTFTDATASQYITSTTWDNSLTTTFGATFGIEAEFGIVGIAKESESISVNWDVSISASHGGGTQNMTMHTSSEGTTTFLPNTGADCTSTTYHASGNFKYNTQVTILMVDGTKYNWNEPGSVSTDAYTDTEMVCKTTTSKAAPAGASSGAVVAA